MYDDLMEMIDREADGSDSLEVGHISTHSNTVESMLTSSDIVLFIRLSVVRCQWTHRFVNHHIVFNPSLLTIITSWFGVHCNVLTRS